MKQTTLSDEFKTGIFIKELKNRFLCEVEIDSERVVCYVPSSCHLSNFLKLQKKKVLLVQTTTPSSRTKYALFAVPYKRNYIVLNTTMANRAVESSIERRIFSFLGKRTNVIKEHSVAGYKCDLYIADTDTVIEIKSIISTESRATFPTLYSERTIKQLKQLREIMLCGKKTCLCIVSLHPYVKEITIDQSTGFYSELKQCLHLGMQLHAFTTRLSDCEFKIEQEIPISYSNS